MSISAVGTFHSNSASPATTITFTPNGSSNHWFVFVAVIAQASNAITNITSSPVVMGTATKLFSETDASSTTCDVWIAQVTGTSNSTFTFTWASTPTTQFTDLGCQEYSSTLGVFTQDGSQTGGSFGSGSPYNYPTLIPTNSNELYVGIAAVGNTGQAGNTTGYTYDLLSGGNVFAFDASISASTTPNFSQTPDDGWVTAAGLITDVAASGVNWVPPQLNVYRM